MINTFETNNLKMSKNDYGISLTEKVQYGTGNSIYFKIEHLKELEELIKYAKMYWSL